MKNNRRDFFLGSQNFEKITAVFAKNNRSIQITVAFKKCTKNLENVTILRRRRKFWRQNMVFKGIMWQFSAAGEIFLEDFELNNRRL